jgi:transposase-like protein
MDLHATGLEEVLLGIFNGLPGPEEAMISVYPKANVQLCFIHKVLNSLNSVQKKEQSAASLSQNHESFDLIDFLNHGERIYMYY